MFKKLLVLVLMGGILIFSVFSQENQESNWFSRHFSNKIFLGYYSSYFDDNIRMLQGGYEAALKLINITSNYNLLDVGIGLSGLLAYDFVNENQKDNFGHDRPKNGRTTPGFELNWNVRLFAIPLLKINSCVYIEGCGMSLVVYSIEFPDTGTFVNIGTYLGMGLEFPLNNCKGYATLRWYHTSNGREYHNNPAFNSVGLIIGLQF